LKKSIKVLQILIKMTKPIINTPKGIGEIHSVNISDLGFLMLKVSFKNGTFITYNLGKHDIENNIFTNKIIKDEKNKN
jgi:hypothetical protein